MIISLPTKHISLISQSKTFVRVLPTRWRRKPAGIEIMSVSPYVFTTAAACGRFAAMGSAGRRYCTIAAAGDGARQSAANAGSVTLSAVVGSLLYHLFLFFHFLDEQSLGIFDAGFTWAKQEVY